MNTTRTMRSHHPIDPLLRHIAPPSDTSLPRPVGRRRGKPARRAKATALTLSAASTVALAGLFSHQDDSAGATQLTTVTDPLVSVEAATPATTVAGAGVADGTYVGASDGNRWGTVQVQVVYSGGVLTDVQIIQYPDGDNRSVRINQRALPTLISEALSVQSADVSTVSGATYTSVSYRVSLQSAIDAATAAAGVG